MVPWNTLATSMAFWCLVFQPFLINRARCRVVDGHGKDSTSTTECSVDVMGPFALSPVFQIKGNPVPLQAFYYTLSTKNVAKECALDITRVLQRLSFKSRLSQLLFYVKCVSPVRVLFCRIDDFSKFFVHSTLVIQGSCKVSAKDLADWGRATDLGVLGLKDGVLVLEDDNQTVSDLKGLFNVRTLILQDLSNKRIPRMFTSFVWKNVTKVHFINMSLTSIPKALKHTMPNLQVLILTHNRLHKPPYFPWCNTRLELPRNLSRTAFGNQLHFTKFKISVNPRMCYRFLIVEDNPGLDVSKFEFITGSLDGVFLRGNGLQRIKPTIFDKINELKAIDLSLNKFREIPAQIFRKADAVVDINLANNRLEFLAWETFQELRELRRLNLSHNFIQTLQSGLLTGANNLEEINLEQNSLRTVERKALPCDSNSFKKINLRRNYLRHIPQCAFHAPNLEAFGMSDNIVDHRSFLETLDSLEITDFMMSHTEFIHRTPNKKIIKLERNKIEHFDVTQFNETRLRKFELILKAYTLNIGNNPLMCDCKLRYLQLKLWNWTRTVKEITVDQFDSWKCHTPEDLGGRKVLSVPQEELKCEIQRPKCPAQCKCYERPPGLPIFVDCRNRNLTEVPNEVPEEAVELRLEYNQIHNLSLHSSLLNVTSLYVSHNILRHVSLNFSSKLHEIFLDSNKLTTLPKNFQTFNFSKIDIRNNFFKCDCRNVWMKKWLPRVDHALVGGARSVSCSSGENQGKPLVSVKDDDFICSISNKHNENVPKLSVLPTLAYILGGLLFTLILLGFMYCFKGEFKLLLFARLKWHPFDRADDSDLSKIYDAFVSYSGRDIEWVMNTLREKLENEDPPYKLCIHDRDFLVGAPISQNIFDSVKASRRMIMVLSKHFVQSEWCMLEFRAAHQQVLRDRTNYLIIVLFDDVDTRNLDDELKLYLRTNTYLKIDSRWFWQKLRYALPQERLCNGQTRLFVEENEGYESQELL